MTVQQPTSEMIKEKYDQLMKKATTAFNSVFGMIEPEYLLGFEEGKPLNLKAYKSIKFDHPKDQNYYVIKEFDSEGMPKKPDKGGVYVDSDFASIYEGIVTSNKIDEPILIFYFGEKLLVLNGATRLSVISQRRKFDPSFMKRVPVQVFRGNDLEARGEMVRTNLEGRVRSLKSKELTGAIQNIIRNDTEIAIGRLRYILTGSEQGSYHMNNLITIVTKGSEKIIRAYEKLGQAGSGKMTIGKLATIADSNESHQKQDEELVKSYEKSREEILISIHGARAIPEKLRGIKSSLAKSYQYCETCGISDQTGPTFEAIHSKIDELIKIIEEVDKTSDLVATNNTDHDEVSVQDDEIYENALNDNDAEGEDDLSDLLKNHDDDDDDNDAPHDYLDDPNDAYACLKNLDQGSDDLIEEDGDDYDDDDGITTPASLLKMPTESPEPKAAKTRSDGRNFEGDDPIEPDMAVKVFARLKETQGGRRFSCNEIFNVLGEFRKVPDFKSKIVQGRWVSSNFVSNYSRKKDAAGSSYLAKHTNNKYTIETT